MATTYRETERKYEASDHTELPSWVGIFGDLRARGEEQTLNATYLDTADLRMAGAGITLRHRIGDDVAGWHLKLPVSKFARDEIRLPDQHGPVPDATPGPPPAEFADLLRAFTAEADIVPVATMLTHRTLLRWVDDSGRELLTVTDDRVTARTLPDGADRSWREFEVELGADADPDLLDRADALLRGAGVRRSKSSSKLARALGPRLPPQPAPPDRRASAGEVVLDYLKAQVAAIRRNDLEVRRDSPDSVHQLRVSLRRTRSTLQAFRTVLDRRRTQPLIDELRWLGEAAGRDRDLEVLRVRFTAELAGLAAEDALGPVQARVSHWFAPRQAEARATLLEALNSPRHLALLSALDDLLAHPPLRSPAARPAPAVLPVDVTRANRRVRRHLKAAPPGAAGRDLELHEARKATKRLRYAAEAAAPAVARAAKLVKPTKKLQGLLGEHQDAVVAAPVLRELAIAGHGAGENGYPFGLIAGRALGRGVDEAGLAEAGARVRKAVRKLKS